MELIGAAMALTGCLGMAHVVWYIWKQWKQSGAKANSVRGRQ